MPLRSFALAVVISLAACIPARSAERYVAPTGNNGGGNTGTNIASPLATIAQAITLSAPGDTIWVRGGTYNLASTLTISTSKNGTALAPFKLLAYQNETPILDFRTQALGQRGIDLQANYWHMKGLTVQYAGDNGVILSGSNNILEQLTTRLNNDSGIQLAGSGVRVPSNNLILNSDSYANYDYQGDSRGENADGFAAKFRGLGPGNVFKGVRAWNNSDDGFDFWQAANGVTIENSWTFHNGRSSLFTGVPGTFNGDGNGIKLGHDSGTHLLKGNLVWGNPANGIDINGNATQLEGDPPTITHGVTILNNTAVNNSSRNFRFDEDPTTATPPTTHTLRNNLSYLGGGVQIDTGNTHDHNSWNPGVTVSAADFVSTVDPLTTNGAYAPITDRAGTTTPTFATGPAVAARLADGSLPQLNFMRLVAGSDLVNAGVNVGLPFSGSAPDIGAFEYIPAIVYNPADFNQDGFVRVDDLVALRAGYGLTSGATKAQGDADLDGDVDGQDLLIWQRNLNAANAAAAGGLIPEPQTFVLGVGACLLAARRRRR